MIFTPGQLNRRAELYHQLGSMITAGVPLISALQTVSNTRSMRSYKKAMTAIVDHLKNGLSFSDSMQRVPGWLPKFDEALLTAGEHSGKLDASFKMLAHHYATRATILRDMIGRLMLPAANLHVFLLVFPLSVLIGLATGIFNSDYSKCVPFIVEKTVVFGGLYFLIFFFIFASQGKHGERWRSFLESFAKIFPLLGTARKYLVHARLAAALEALISAGVSVVSAWPLAAAASGSPRLKRDVAEWKEPLEQGHTPSEMVRENPYFHEMFVNQYYTGEISGKLDESLQRMHTFYQEEGFRALSLFTRVTSGTLYGLIALLIAYNVIKFWMNYYGNLMNSMAPLN
jgi:type II secretory pathway component PulF